MSWARRGAYSTEALGSLGGALGAFGAFWALRRTVVATVGGPLLGSGPPWTRCPVPPSPLEFWSSLAQQQVNQQLHRVAGSRELKYMTDRTTTSQNLWTVTCPRRSLASPSLPHARWLWHSGPQALTLSLRRRSVAPSLSSPSCSSSPPAPFFSQPSSPLVSRRRCCSNSPISSSSKRVKSQTSGSAPLRAPCSCAQQTLFALACRSKRTQ